MLRGMIMVLCRKGCDLAMGKDSILLGFCVLVLNEMDKVKKGLACEEVEAAH